MPPLQRAALQGVRVLELPSPMTGYCGKLFADLGAQVILVEPPGGARTRLEAPHLHGVAAADGSLSFAYFNTNKQSITLDLSAPRGQEIFRRLAASSQLVVEGERPGLMAQRGLAYTDLSRCARQVILTSITPFGQSGPYAQYEAEDIVLLALGGLLYLGGYPDTAPMRAWGNQACLSASQIGAVASLVALLDAERSGAGQHVDVSAQQCVVMAMETAIQFYELEGTVRKRYAGQQRFAGTGVFKCSDGEILVMAAGVGEPRFWKPTVDWLREEGMAGVDRIADAKWADTRYLGTPEAKAIFHEVFAPFALARTKEYLYHEGQRRRIPVAPVATPADLVNNRQLAYRNYFVDVPHASGAALRMPGAPYKLSRTPWRIREGSPRLGAHTDEVLAAAGVPAGELTQLRAESII